MEDEISMAEEGQDEISKPEVGQDKMPIAEEGQDETAMAEEGQDETAMAEVGQDAGRCSGGGTGGGPVPTKAGRANPITKNLQVCITQVNLSELGSHISNDGATVLLESPLTPARGRGRPKGSGSTKRSKSEAGPSKKRSRPKGSVKKTVQKKAESDDDYGEYLSESSEDKGIADDESEEYSPSKRAVGRSKRRGRPKGSRARVESSDSDKDYSPIKRKRDVGGSKTSKRGRPKSSTKARGRPRKSASKRGAHLKKQIPSAITDEEVEKNGEIAAASSPPTNSDVGAPKKRGRPPKKSAITDEEVEKNGEIAAASSPPRNSYVGPPKKRGRPTKKSAIVNEKVEKNGEIASQEKHSSAVDEVVEKNGEIAAASSPLGASDVGPPRKKGRPPKKRPIADE